MEDLRAYVNAIKRDIHVAFDQIRKIKSDIIDKTVLNKDFAMNSEASCLCLGSNRFWALTRNNATLATFCYPPRWVQRFQVSLCKFLAESVQ